MRLLDDKIAVVPHDPFAKPKKDDPDKVELYLTDEVKERMAEDGPKFIYSKVVMAGPGKRLDNGDRRPMEIKEGDVVFHYGKAGFEAKDADGREIRIIGEADVIVVL